MDVLNSVDVDHVGSGQRELHLASGHVVDIQPGIEYLGIRCQPGQYSPDSNEAIRELDALGVSVESLERRPACDFRPTLPCWISAPISAPGVNIRQLLVWEPDLEEDTASALPRVRDAFQALDLFAGKVGGESAAFLLWPGKGEDQPQDVFRMQFFSAMSLACRSRWSGLYLLVKPDQADEARVWFGGLAERYIDPLLWPPSMSRTAIAELELPETLSQWAEAAGTRAHADIQSETVLTERQFLAIREYTDLGYQTINETLRRGDLRHPDFIAVQALIEALSAGLAGLPNSIAPVKRMVFEFDGFEDIYQPGKLATELAFTSTTRLQPVESLNRRIWYFYIASFLGKYIAPLSTYPSERETLFDHGMKHLPWSMGADDFHGECLSQEVMPAEIGIRYSHL